ncbi:hypothetical protein [Nocardiopsis sp. NPDC006938]|uniref:hypothetical protein n=1 Tax=Nocardiopsis sp. NPDC006938 TaxID=3364337 RepID=UPI0036AF7C14
MSPTAPTNGSAAELLASLEGLGHHARTRELALYARLRSSTPRSEPLQRELSALGHHRDALHAAIVAKDLETVAGYLSGPDMELRGAALRAVRTLPLPDPVISAALDDAPGGLRRALYRSLFQGRRAELADTLLEQVRAEHGDAEAAALLPACSRDTVRHRLPELVHAVRSWRRLARRHPDTLADHIADRFGAADADLFVQHRWQRALTALDPVRPARVAEIVGPDQMRRYPHAVRVCDAAAHRRSPHPEVSRGRRADRELIRAMRTRPATARCVLRSLPRKEAATLVDRTVAQWNGPRSPEGLLPFLGLLPRDRAADLAREALTELAVFQRVNSRSHIPDQDLDAIAHLPYAEAAEQLGEAASCGDPDRRARGLARLVEATARTGDPVLLARVLAERVERHGADRDSVRRALLLALCEVDPRLLVPCLPSLHRLVEDTVRARDTSADTRDVLRHLASLVLRHPDTRVGEPAVLWGTRVYRRLVERFGADGLGEPDRPRHNAPWWAFRRRRRPWWVPQEHGPHRHGPAPRLYQVLPPGAEDLLLEQLSGYLSGARRRGDHGPAVALAAELGHRGRRGTVLDGHLRAAVLADPDPGSATSIRAAALYLTGPDRDRRALSLFEEDPATACLPRVWELLTRRHPASVALSALESAAAVPGGGAHGAAVWVPRVDRALFRDWPTAARDRLLAHLLAVVAEPALAAADRESALRALSGLPGAHRHLASFLDDGEVVLRDAALSALGRCDQPELALELIAAHAGGPRSRAAGPALSRCAERARPSVLGPLLSRVLEGSGKVTVRRTAARLLVRHRPPGAVATLVRVLRRTDEHRDVLAAVAAALLCLADAPGALDGLAERVPDFTEEEIQVALLGVNPEQLAPEVRRAAADTLAALPPPRRTHWRMSGWWGWWTAWGSETLDDVMAAVCDLDQPGERVLATLWQALARGRGQERLAGVLQLLVDQVPGPENPLPVAGTRALERVRDAHRRACRVTGLLQSARLRAPVGDPEMRDQVDRAVDLLTARPELLDIALPLLEVDLRLAVRAAEDTDEAEPLVAHLLRLARLLARRPGYHDDRWDSMVRPLCGRNGGSGVGWETAAQVARRLLDEAEADGGRVGQMTGLLGLALVRNALNGSSWARPWPELLAVAERCRHEEVRLGAWATTVR